MSTLQVGTISEKVTNAGVAVDGVTLKDGGATFTSAVGVTGNTTITSGNLVIGTAGQGIDFSNASGSASGSTSALLEDYEEGTWTPVFKDNNSTVIATTQVTAKYRKVGNLVTAEFTAQRNTSSSLTGTFYITGLPFTSTNVPALRGQMWVDNITSDVKCFLYVGSTSTEGFFPKTGTNDLALITSDWTNNRYVYGAITYLHN
tara:strand:- start:2220 stop:2828 length:609 start_codon:yes stop_codon:yes gene_type:complete